MSNLQRKPLYVKKGYIFVFRDILKTVPKSFIEF